MATEQRKTVWLNVYEGMYGAVTAHPDKLAAESSMFANLRQGPAVQVDLIRTPEGWKQDERVGRIECLKEFLAILASYHSYTPREIRSVLRDQIAQLEELAQ